MGHVVIFGATELAVMCHYYLTNDSPHKVVAFTVDQAYLKDDTLCGLPIVPFENIEMSHPAADYQMLVAIWYGRVNQTRAEKYYQVKAKGYQLISYVHSRAITWSGMVIGDNSLIFENAVCQPFSQIGNDVIVRSSCDISHHAVIKDHCYLASRAVVLGGATVEPYCFIGANAVIRNDITVARQCVIGAGALILDSTRERGVYRGNSSMLLPMPSDALTKI